MSWFMRMVGKSGKTHGFTLVELAIVVVIVGVLAAVALGVYRGYTRKAMATEATAGLGTIRTALRVVYARHEDYTSGATIAVGAVGAQVPGIDAGDLQGTYFDHDDYAIDTITGTTFELSCTGDADSGQGNAEGRATGVRVTLNQDGDETYSYTAP